MAAGPSLREIIKQRLAFVGIECPEEDLEGPVRILTMVKPMFNALDNVAVEGIEPAVAFFCQPGSGAKP